MPGYDCYLGSCSLSFLAEPQFDSLEECQAAGCGRTRWECVPGTGRAQQEIRQCIELVGGRVGPGVYDTLEGCAADCQIPPYGAG